MVQMVINWLYTRVLSVPVHSLLIYTVIQTIKVKTKDQISDEDKLKEVNENETLVEGFDVQ